MTSEEKTLEAILELGNPSERCARAELRARALQVALRLTNADGAVLVMASGSKHGERLVLHAGSTAPARIPPADAGADVMHGFTRNCLPLAVADLSEEALLATGHACPGVEAGPVLFTPLRQRDPLPGYLAVYRKRGRARFSANEARQMLLLGAWLTTALENLRLAIGTERLAVTDEVTEVYNQRFLRTALRREIQRASRFRQELSLVLIDVDNFKALVEEHGELKGSLLLKEIATELAQHVRSFDVLGKNGDDAFILILPQTGAEGAAEVAERMRAIVEQHGFGGVPAGTITVSAGVASFPQAGTDIKRLLAAAERALHEAKDQGRNRVASVAQKAA